MIRYIILRKGDEWGAGIYGTQEEAKQILAALQWDHPDGAWTGAVVVPVRITRLDSTAL